MFGPKAQRQQRQQRQSRPGQRLGAKGLRQISRTFWARPETPPHKYWLASAPRNERSNKPPFCGSTIKSSSSRSTCSPLLDPLLSENKMELAAIPLPQLSKWDIFIQNARSGSCHSIKQSVPKKCLFLFLNYSAFLFLNNRAFLK